MRPRGQLEWRTALELSQDEVGIEEILNKDDIHSNNQAAFQLPSRLIAKIFLFRTIFRGSGWSFANDPDFMHVSTSASFWDDMNEKFYKKYNGLDKCHTRWTELVVAGKPIIGPSGRSWLIPMKEGFKIPLTTLTNYPIQGSGADVMMVARISAHRRIKALGIPCKWVSTVHDSIVVDVPNEYIQTVVDVFHQVFDDLPANMLRVFKYKWRVPMACETKQGLNMKDMQKIAPTY